MEKDRQRLIEDKKALEDAVRRAVAYGDSEEVERLMEHLEDIEIQLKGEQK